MIYLRNLYYRAVYYFFGIICYNPGAFIDYVESLGFYFPQGEECVKGDLTIYCDCADGYLIEGKNESKWFTTLRQFNKFYRNYNQTTNHK